ncbi:hypothetical protein SALBM217S_05204 [Streptomyces griseoloalbus]
MVSATALWWMDLLVLAFALVVPVLVILSPVDDPGAWPLTPVGVGLLAAAPYTITAWAGARAAVTRLMLARRDDELGRALTDVRACAPASSTPSTRNAAVSSATCTTGRSNGWSPST